MTTPISDKQKTPLPSQTFSNILPTGSTPPTEESTSGNQATTPPYAGPAEEQGSTESHALATISSHLDSSHLDSSDIASQLRQYLYNKNLEPDKNHTSYSNAVAEIAQGYPVVDLTDEDYASVGLYPAVAGQASAGQLTTLPAIPQSSLADLFRVTTPLSLAVQSPGTAIQHTAGVVAEKSLEVELGNHLRQGDRFTMAAPPLSQDYNPPTSILQSNEHREAESRAGPGFYDPERLIEDSDEVRDPRDDEIPQQTYSRISAKPAGPATPSAIAQSQTRFFGLTSTPECIATSKPLMKQLLSIVLPVIRNEDEPFEKGETIQKLIQDFYSQCTLREADSSDIDDEAVFDFIIKTLKRKIEPETKFRAIITHIDPLFAERGWHLPDRVLVPHEIEQSIVGDEGSSDSGIGTSVVESQTRRKPKKSAKGTSVDYKSRGTKRQRLQSKSTIRAPSLAPSRQSSATQQLETETERKCYIKGCRRRKPITSSQKQHKHYFSHYPKEAALCPFVYDDGLACPKVFDSEHYRSNLPDHLRKEHRVSASFLESSTFQEQYLDPTLLIPISDRYHTFCLFCPAEFSDAKTSRMHVLKHMKNDSTEKLEESYLKYGHRCADKLCGSEDYWRTSQNIREAMAAPRELSRPIILSEGESTSITSRTSDIGVGYTGTRFSVSYSQTMRDNEHGGHHSSPTSDYSSQPLSHSVYHSPYGVVSRQRLQDLGATITARTPLQMPMERWRYATIRSEPWNNLDDVIVQLDPPWDKLAPASIANEIGQVVDSFENMAIGIKRFGDEDTCSTDDSDTSSAGCGMALIWHPTR